MSTEFVSNCNPISAQSQLRVVGLLVHVALSKQIIGFDLISHYRLYDCVFVAGIQFTLMHPHLFTILSHTQTHTNTLILHMGRYLPVVKLNNGARECATLIDTCTDP